MKILKSEQWLESFPMQPFLEKLENAKITQVERAILTLGKFRVRFWTVLIDYTYVREILKRIDNDLHNNMKFDEKLREIAEDGKKRVKWSELPPSSPILTQVDIMSLIIFLNILMDDTARFLQLLFRHGDMPKTKDFTALRKDISNFEGSSFGKLANIINSAIWYDDLETLRDKLVVHFGKRSPAIGIRKDEVGSYFMSIEKSVRDTFFSNKKIDELCSNVRSFFIDLDEYLCENFDYLPLEIRRIAKA